MAYETGTASGADDLLSKLRTFVTANGWSEDAWSVDGSGHRFHANKDGVYVNFRAYVNESPSSSVINNGTGVYSVAMNMGTGYNGSNPWFQQDGTAIGASSRYATAGLTSLSASIPAYHFFAKDSGKNIVVVIEWSAGLYQYLCFGTLRKFGTFTGGQYYCASTTGVHNQIDYTGLNGSWLGAGFWDGWQSGFNATAFANATVDAESGWKWGRNAGSPPSSTRRSLCNRELHQMGSWNINPNSSNGLSTFTPVQVRCYRDTNNNASSPISPLGEIPGLFYCGIAALNPAQQVTLGSTNYRVFPFIRKQPAPSTAGPGLTPFAHSGGWGFAVEE